MQSRAGGRAGRCAREGGVPRRRVRCRDRRQQRVHLVPGRPRVQRPQQGPVQHGRVRSEQPVHVLPVGPHVRPPLQAGLHHHQVRHLERVHGLPVGPHVQRHAQDAVHQHERGAQVHQRQRVHGLPLGPHVRRHNDHCCVHQLNLDAATIITIEADATRTGEVTIDTNGVLEIATATTSTSTASKTTASKTAL